MRPGYPHFPRRKESSRSDNGLAMSLKGLIGIRSKRLPHRGISSGVSSMSRGSRASWQKSSSRKHQGSINQKCSLQAAQSGARGSQFTHPLITGMIWGLSITMETSIKHHLEHPEKYSTKWLAQLISVTSHSSRVSLAPANMEQVRTPTERQEAVTFDSINTRCLVDDTSTVSERKVSSFQ